MIFKDLVDEQMAGYHQGDYADHSSARDMLTRFANAVASVEREACAQAFEAEVDTWDEMKKAGYLGAIRRMGAKAIRMRSNV